MFFIDRRWGRNAVRPVLERARHAAFGLWLAGMRSLIRRHGRALRVTGAAPAALLLLAVVVIGGGAPAGAQETEGAGAEIRLSGMVDRITRTIIHQFTVELTNLTATEDYQVLVSSDSAALGIGGCGAVQMRTVTGATARDLTFIMHACAVGEGTVTAAVRRAGANAAEASVSRGVTVEALPEIVIGPTGERIRTTEAAAQGAQAATAQGAQQVGRPDFVRGISFPEADRKATSVKVTWGETPNGGRALTGFGLLFWRKGDTPPAYNRALVKGAGARSHTYTGLQPATTYRFRIHACNGRDSCGYWTNPAKEVTTKPHVGRPAKPHTIRVDEIEQTSARVRWSPDADTGGRALTGFGIRWRVKGTSWPSRAQAPNVPPGDKRYTMSPLTADTTYEVSLQACNGTDSCSAWTQKLEFKTLPVRPPGKPHTIEFPDDKRKPTKVTVTWRAPGDTGGAPLTGFLLMRRTEGTSWPPDSHRAVVGADRREYTFTGLSANTTYEIRIRACNDDDENRCSGWVDGNKVTTRAVGPPTGKHTIGVDQVTDTTARLNWSPDADTGGRPITGFGIRWREVGDDWPTEAQGVVDQNARNYVITGLVRGTMYEVSIQTCNGTDSCSPWTDALEFETTGTSSEPDDTPGPVRDLEITGVGDGTLTVDWKPPASPSDAVTGYKLQSRQSGSSWPSTSTPVTASEKNISGLTNGTKYDVQVQACNGDDCGEWTGPVCGRPGTTTKPEQLAVESVTSRSETLTVTWAPPACVSALTHYEVQAAEDPTPPASPAWPIRGEEVLAGTTEKELGSLTNGTTYLVRVRACNTARTPANDQCGDWSAPSDKAKGTPSERQLPTPVNLDVVPLPQRKALLKWDAVPDATGYIVQLRERGSAWPASVTVDNRTVATSSIEIDLDGILQIIDRSDPLNPKIVPHKGLGDEPAFEFRVQATANNFAPSGHSRHVIIIDTPITSANGHSPGTGATSGKAAITWTSLDTLHTGSLFSGGTYKLRYRRSMYPYFFSGWDPGAFDSAADPASRGEIAASSPTSHTFTRLTRDSIYAIQLLYEKDGRTVFSVRDSYVWPSDDSFGSEGIATFPVDDYPLTTKSSDGRSMEFHYHICTDTFPSSDPEDDWVPFINHAMLQWQHATDELVKMKYARNECIDYTIFLDDLVEEARGIADDLVAALTPRGITPEQIVEAIRSRITVDGKELIKSFKDTGIDGTKLGQDSVSDAQMSEIMMIRDGDWSDEDHVVFAFLKFGGQIGLGGCEGGCAQAEKYGSTTSTDIYLRESYHVTDGHGILQALIQPGAALEIQFNTCPNFNANYHLPYSSIVHEAGHALGLGHPDKSQVKTAIMSYFKPHPPQCAPHPLDVMAIYALYQSKVNR
ncbi:MAG: fibronectin type III domain-containing protein [Chloroflexi bacterium]|nr:fibronectin type III domain-containing protein [Chloroflexota bacterium]